MPEKSNNHIEQGEEKSFSFKKTWKNYWHVFILVIVIALFTINTANFISKDKSPIIGDTLIQTQLANIHYQAMRQSFPGGLFKSIANQEVRHPPLTHLVTSLFFRIFGVSLEIAIWSIYPFSIIMMLVIFFTGYHFGGKTGAVASLLIGSSNCHFINYSHTYMLDIPHASMTCLAFFLLLKSDSFKKPAFSYLFGATLGLAALARINSIYFLVGPLLVLLVYFSYRSIRIFLMALFFSGSILGTGFYLFSLCKKSLELSPDSNVNVFFGKSIIILALLLAILTTISLLTEKRFMSLFKEENRNYTHCFLVGIRSIMLSMAIFMPFYILKSQTVLRFYNSHYREYKLFNPEVIWQYFIRNIIQMEDFFPLVFILSAAGIIFIFLKKKHILDFLILISMGAGGLIITSLTADSMTRYLLAELLALSVISGYWITYTGKLKYPLFAYIFSFYLLVTAYPFYSPDVPGYPWGFYNWRFRNRIARMPIKQKSFMDKLDKVNRKIESSKMFLLEPLPPRNPNPDTLKLYAISQDIVNTYQHRDIKEKYPGTELFLYFKYSEDYLLSLEENSMQDDYFTILVQQSLWYEGLPIQSRPPRGKENLERFIKEKDGNPVILMIGFKDPSYPASILNLLKSSGERAIVKIGRYGVGGKKMIDVYLLESIH